MIQMIRWQKKSLSDCMDAQADLSAHVRRYIFSRSSSNYDYLLIKKKYLRYQQTTDNLSTLACTNNISKEALKKFSTCHTMSKFSTRQTDCICLIFPRKYDLTLHVNCLIRKQFAKSVKSYFLGKMRKLFQNIVCLKYLPSMQKKC